MNSSTHQTFSDRSDKNVHSELAEITDTLFKLSEEMITEAGNTKRKEFKEAVNNFSAHLILNFFHQYEIMSVANSKKSYKTAEIIEIIGIKPVYHRLTEYMLLFLAECGYLKKENENYSLIEQKQKNNIDDLFNKYINVFSDYSGTFKLLMHFMKYYPEVLTGKISPLSVMFPDGTACLLTSFTNTERTMGELTEFTAIKCIGQFIIKNTKKSLKILEVGAGLGMVGRAVFPALSNKQVEYYYTDIGRSVIVNAKQQFSDYPFLRFEVFNIEQDPVKQGFYPGEFDIIIALNVIHATRSLNHSLGNLKKVLSPGGVLFVIEKVQSEPVENLIWGMTEGWWLFEDTELRKNSPIVSALCWKELLKQQKFSHIYSYPKDYGIMNESESALIIGIC